MELNGAMVNWPGTNTSYKWTQAQGFSVVTNQSDIDNWYAEAIPLAEDRKLSKSLSYQLKVVNIDYLRDFHAQGAN